MRFFYLVETAGLCGRKAVWNTFPEAVRDYEIQVEEEKRWSQFTGTPARTVVLFLVEGTHSGNQLQYTTEVYGRRLWLRSTLDAKVPAHFNYGWEIEPLLERLATMPAHIFLDQLFEEGNLSSRAQHALAFVFFPPQAEKSLDEFLSF